ncbi:MAG: cytochrome c [Bacteroidetes bacterium]|nr:cytochrome c [Bacteroidota bacterium]
MNRKHLLVVIAIISAFIYSCGSNQQPSANNAPANATLKEPGDSTGIPVTSDDSKGKGKFTDIKLSHPLDQKLIASGKTIYDVKCNACHKLTDEKLVGPGWKGVTDRRKPEWIMNFVTNTDEMIDKDPAAQAMLEKCMVRMPNQHLSDEDARSILEFMRNNDGKN